MRNAAQGSGALKMEDIIMAGSRHVPVHGANRLWPNVLEPFWTIGRHVADLFQPDADASHDADGYRVSLEVPGVDEADIDVTIEDDILTIKGEKRTEKEEKKRDYYFSERTYGTFQRAFQIPKDVDREHIRAKVDKGVLTLTLPKSPEREAEKQKIAVERH